MSGEEEWEVPIGLTKEHAICVDDSDDEEEAVDGIAGLGGCVDENEARGEIIGDSFPLQVVELILQPHTTKKICVCLLLLIPIQKYHSNAETLNKRSHAMHKICGQKVLLRNNQVLNNHPPIIKKQMI